MLCPFRIILIFSCLLNGSRSSGINKPPCTKIIHEDFTPVTKLCLLQRKRFLKCYPVSHQQSLIAFCDQAFKVSIRQRLLQLELIELQMIWVDMKANNHDLGHVHSSSLTANFLFYLKPELVTCACSHRASRQPLSLKMYPNKHWKPMEGGKNRSNTLSSTRPRQQPNE